MGMTRGGVMWVGAAIVMAVAIGGSASHGNAVRAAPSATGATRRRGNRRRRNSRPRTLRSPKASSPEARSIPAPGVRYWVYIPKQLDRTKPAPVMVFQDGLQYNAPNVFDDLIAKKAIPPLVGVFVMHGRVKALSADALDRMNRSFEYDAVSGDYAKFLLDELLPFVAKTHNLTLSNDPNDRAIAGNSSGAIAAFVAAWQRPDAFRRVFSAIGTYVGLRGGNEFPVLIRKTEPKPIRVFLRGRPQRSEQLHRQLVHRQSGHVVGVRIRRLRRASRVGRRRAQLASRHRAVSRGGDVAVERLAGADQGESRKGSRSRTSIRCSCRVKSGRR